MGMQSVRHAAVPLLMGSVLRAIVDAAARHGLPTAEALLDRLPLFSTFLRGQAAALHGMGVQDAESLTHLIAQLDGPKVASTWRLAACARSLSLFDSGADAEAIVTRREAGGPGAGGWLMVPTPPPLA